MQLPNRSRGALVATRPTLDSDPSSAPRDQLGALSHAACANQLVPLRPRRSLHPLSYDIPERSPTRSRPARRRTFLAAGSQQSARLPMRGAAWIARHPSNGLASTRARHPVLLPSPPLPRGSDRGFFRPGPRRRPKRQPIARSRPRSPTNFRFVPLPSDLYGPLCVAAVSPPPPVAVSRGCKPRSVLASPWLACRTFRLARAFERRSSPSRSTGGSACRLRAGPGWSGRMLP